MTIAHLVYEPIVQMTIIAAFLFSYGVVRAATGTPCWSISVADPADPANVPLQERHQRRQMFKHRLYLSLLSLLAGVVIACVIWTLFPVPGSSPGWLRMILVAMALGLALIGERLATRKTLLLKDERVAFPLHVECVVRKKGRKGVV